MWLFNTFWLNKSSHVNLVTSKDLKPDLRMIQSANGVVPMEPIRPFDSDMKEMTTIPPSQATNSVWLLFGLDILRELS